MEDMVNEGNHPLASDLDQILFHTSGLWEEFRDQRVFITGGTGFFGSWFLEAFVWANHKLNLNAEAVVLTRNPEHFKKKAPHLASDPSVRFHIGDVRDFQFAPGRFFYIIHASNEGQFNAVQENGLSLIENMTKAATHVLEFAGGCGAKKLLFTSSGSVYGPLPPDQSVGEDYVGSRDPRVPRYAHGEGKHRVESLFAQNLKRHGVEAKIARCFSFVGPYLSLNEGYAIGNFIRDAIRGETIDVNGDGTPIRSYLYASDLIIWLLSILIDGQPCRPYNVGSEIALNIKSLAETVAQCFGIPKKVRIAKDPTPGRLPERYVPSTARARAELGLSQVVSLSEGIRRTLKWQEARDKAMQKGGKYE